MNNLKNYDNFVNEELVFFNSEYIEIVNRICKYVNKMNINDVETIDAHGYRSYRFVIKGKPLNKSDDPYGEEGTEDDVEITVETDDNPRLWIDNEKIPAKSGEVLKIKNIIRDRKNNYKRDELNKKLAKVIDRI